MYSTYSSSSDEESNDSDSNGRNPTKLERLQEKQKKDCWNKCDYPSECRWGRQYGVHTPVTVDFPNIWVDSTPTLVSNETSESILKSENAPAKAKGKMKNAEKTDFWSTLVASATRRKSGPPSSPLASVPEEDERALDSPESARDNYNDVVSRSQSETFISPRQLSSTMTEPTTASLPKVTLKDMIRKASKHCHSSKPAESISPEPISQASPRVAPIAEFHFGFDSREDLSMEEFPLLERVASQDSGYVSSTSTEIEL
jgi:hypothetical protein